MVKGELHRLSVTALVTLVGFATQGLSEASVGYLRFTGYFLKIFATPLLIGLATVFASDCKSALGARCNTSVIVPRKIVRSLLLSNRSITSVPVVTSHMFIVALPTIPL